jgi:hypothetical protein
MSLEAARKGLNSWPSDRIVLPLCLDVDEIEAELVLLDDAVDSIVTALAHRLTGIGQRAAVPHCHQKIDHQLLEELWSVLLDPFEQLVSQKAA